LVLVDGLSTVSVDLSSSVACALAQAISITYGGSIEALGFVLSATGDIVDYKLPPYPTGSSSMVGMIAYEAAVALGKRLASGGTPEYMQGRLRALTHLTDALATFTAATATRNPALVATAIVGWIAELYIRGTAIIPPRVGDWTSPANSVCADHVSTIFHPAVQAAIQARTQAGIDAQAQAVTALNAKLQEQMAAQATAHAAAIAKALASARTPREPRKREGGGGGGSAAGTESSSSKRAKSAQAKRSYYDETAEARKIIVDYAVNCPLHGPGHKASECNCILKPIGCATTVPARYKDTKYPADGKSMDTTSKC
jgi:hypothetical protein